MNTNSKHYETLNIQPWEIMEANFTTEEFIAYLKGNIIKYALRSKGQDLADAQKIRHYAEKLIEVQKGRPVLVAEKLEEVAEAPLVKREKTHTYKVGDRVRLVVTNETGTIIRTPVEGLREVDKENYIIELDEEYKGWDANKKEHLVDSDNAWYADDEELEALTEESYKFKVGDRVKIDSGWSSKSMKGTVIRTPVKELVQCHDCYIVELDEEENEGWKANLKDHLVVSNSAWFVSEDDIKLLKPAKDKTLEIGRWYDASTFDEEELKELLQVGTKIEVLTSLREDCNHNIDYNIVSPTSNKRATLDKVEAYRDDTAVFIKGHDLYYNWFKITNEEPKKALEPNKWYDASLYTVDELKELLPVGTKVIVTATHDNDRKVKLEKEIVKEDKVEKVTKRTISKDTRIGLMNDCWFRRYFKIIE